MVRAAGIKSGGREGAEERAQVNQKSRNVVGRWRRGKRQMPREANLTAKARSKADQPLLATVAAFTSSKPERGKVPLVIKCSTFRDFICIAMEGNVLTNIP